MSFQKKSPSSYEYNSKYRMLVVRTNPDSMPKFTDYILFFFSFLKEIEINPVENIVIHTPDFPIAYITKMHFWFNNYILPQLIHLDVCRIAIVTGIKTNNPTYVPESSESQQKPLIGKFSTIAEAKAWIIGLISSSNHCEQKMTRTISTQKTG